MKDNKTMVEEVFSSLMGKDIIKEAMVKEVLDNKAMDNNQGTDNNQAMGNNQGMDNSQAMDKVMDREVSGKTPTIEIKC